MILILCRCCLAVWTVIQGESSGPKDCNCTKEHVPVECANGETYANQCVAKCAEAKECKLIEDGESHIYASQPCLAESGRVACSSQ